MEKKIICCVITGWYSLCSFLLSAILCVCVCRFQLALMSIKLMIETSSVANKAAHGPTVNSNDADCENAALIDSLRAAGLVFIQQPLTAKYTWSIQ